jgi:hypothetical protein
VLSYRSVPGPPRPEGTLGTATRLTRASNLRSGSSRNQQCSSVLTESTGQGGGKGVGRTATDLDQQTARPRVP